MTVNLSRCQVMNMKEKTTTKVVRVDDEIEVLVSERNSLDSNLGSSCSDEDSKYPLVIAGNHKVFIDVKDEKDDEVTFKSSDFITKIKTEDTKPLINTMSFVKSSDINQHFQNFKPQVKEEVNCVSFPECFTSEAGVEEKSLEKQDKEPRFLAKSKGTCIQENSRAFLWKDSGGSEMMYPTYFVESQSGLSCNVFDKTKNVVHVKEEITGSLDIKPILHETGTCHFELDSQHSSPSNFNKSLNGFVTEKAITPYELPSLTKQFISNNGGSAANSVLIPEDTKVCVKEEIKAAASTLDKGAVLQGHKCRKRELDLLYDNLKEISWAQDKSFTNLLGDKEVHKRLERISGSKGGNLTSRRKPISISIGKKIIKKVSAHQRKCPAKSKGAKKNEKGQNEHSKFLKGKLATKQKIKWFQTSANPKNSKNKSAELLVQGKKKFNKLKPKLSSKTKSGECKKQVVVNEASKLPSDLKSTSKQSSSSSGSLKKIQNSKAGKQEERKKKDLSLKCGAICKKESGELKDLIVEENGFDISESLQRGPELRVTIEPLENRDNWTNDIFKKRNFHQTAYKAKIVSAFSGMHQRNVESVLQGVNDSIIIRNNVKTARKRKYEEESVRTSVRQSECAFRYKEIVVKKHPDYMQVVLVPNALKQNCLSIEAMKELREAFVSAKKDSNCKAVLLNSSGSFFCSGIDLSQLLGPNKKQAAEEMAHTIRDLIETIAFFHKPVVAAVNGHAAGLGVTLLTFCDIVLASDKATFCIPAATLGYLPEGGICLTLPQVVGATVAVEMLLQGRKLTAEQALNYGLVSEVLWPTHLMENVAPRMQSLVSQSAQVLWATKSMARCYLWEKLTVQLTQEWPILCTQWQHPTCQQNIKKLLQTGWLNM